jgi:urea transport system substrate-binding protein
VRSVAIGQVSGFDAIVDEIRRCGTDIVLDTMEAESDQIFFKTLGRRGIKAAELPVVSLCLGEEQLRTLDPRLIAGHYSALNYFQTIDTPENERFLKRLRAKHVVAWVSSSMEASFLAVRFWKQAVEAAGSLETGRVRAAVAGLELKAPEGLVRIDLTNYYGARIARVGRMGTDGHFEIVFSWPRPMDTIIYPPPHDKAGWEDFLTRLLRGWGGRWTGAAAH